MSSPIKIAVFVSGEGSLFRAVARESENLNCQIELLVTSKINSPAVDFAKQNDIPVQLFSQNIAQLSSQLANSRFEVLLLLGFLKKMPVEIVNAFPGRILNTHPSLLPKFGGKGMYGRHVHDAVLKARESESGCTLHVVTERYDEGPILSQKKIPVHPNDTVESLQRRIKELEFQNLKESLPKYFSSLKR